jgi:hemerythrin-like domain-containing protein
MLESQVRRTILDDHRWLRELLADADEIARRVEEGDHELTGRLRERAQAMRERFVRHLALEEQHLAPALRHADAWGEERAARLLGEHAAQRDRFATLLHELQQPCGDPRPLARAVRSLVHDLLADIEHEETTLLGGRVLDDDPVVVDVEPE